jgi:uncharacterized protein YdaU (DUF1376 family)
MKHYPHHIGDFDKATRHLTRIERSVYRDLIDLYYDTEQRLPLDKAALCRKIIACSNEESTAVEQVLNEFFMETPTGWYHARCEQEIEAYHANTSQKAMAGKASAEAKRLKKLQALNGESTLVEHPLKSVETESQRNSTNQSTNQPINHKPNKRQAVARPDGVSESVWSDFLAMRKAKRSPLTQTALEAIQREADKVPMTIGEALMVCCARGWQGFKAEWVRDLASKTKAAPVSFAQQAADIARTTVPSRVDRDPSLVQLEEDFKKAVPMPDSIREKLSALTRRVSTNDVQNDGFEGA